MANLSNINNKFLVTTGGNVLIGQTSVVGSSILQVTGDITTSGKVNAGDRILTEATTSNSLLQVRYNAFNYLEAYYDTLNVVGGDFLIKRAGDTKIRLTAIGTTFTNLSNTSAASSSVDEIKIGTFGAGRPAIFLGSSNTTYTNSTWFIENIGASGKFRIGRNGLDIMEISNAGTTTFKGEILNAMAAPKIRLKPTTQNNASILELGVLNGGTNAYARIDAINLQNFDTNLRFWTNAPGSTTQVERMRITSDGNVAIAMTPINALDSTLQVCEIGQTVVSGGDIGGKAATFAGTGGASNSSIVTIASTNTSIGAQQGGEIGFAGKFMTGSNQFAQFAKIMSYKADTVSGNYGGGLQFWTRANATPSAVKMTITDLGRVVIGNGTASANTLTLVGSAVELDIHNTSGKRWRFNADTSGNLKFEDKTGGTEAMRIASNGNVGIGTNSPDTKLMVSGEILSENSNGGYFVSTRVPSSSSRPTLNFYGSALDINYVTGYAGGGASTAMTILSGGNVGIGTATPSAKLTVTEDAAASKTILLTNNYATGVEKRYSSLISQYSTADSSFESGFRFLIERATAGNFGSAIGFMTELDSSSKSFDYRMYIKNDKVGIGNTSPQTTLHVGTTTSVTNQFTNQIAASNFFVNGNANGGASFFQCKTAAVNINMMGNNDFACNQFTFYHKPLSTSQNVVGTIATFSSSTQYNTTSDYRLKENVIPLSDSIIRLKQLKPSRFNFIEDPERTMDGFLAHEVQNTVPEAVNGEKDAVDENGNEVHQGIDQAKIVPLLVAAVQEQQEIIESLKQRIEQLEN